jgi:DNA invertase Pin-like site-specific DNA recombinase
MARPNSQEQKIKNLEKYCKSLEDKTSKNTKDIKNAKEDINNLKRQGIRRMLAEKKLNGRYLYSYQEIADEFNVSVGTVNNIAREYGLSRLSAI